MRSRRGAIEVQFNWIFVMLVGSLILVFFFAVVQKQREYSKQKVANTLIGDLEAIATGATVAKGTAQVIDVPDIEIRFSCDDTCLCSYYVENVNRPYKDKIIFAPEELKGTELILWSLDWKIPFRVANFLYITNRNIKYYIIYDDDTSNTYSHQLRNFLNASLPEQMNVEYVPFSEAESIVAKGYPEIKLIFLSLGDENLEEKLELERLTRRTKISAVHILQDRIVIYMEGRSVGVDTPLVGYETAYLEDPSIFAAIFAADLQMYECNMKYAFRRAQQVSTIFQKRVAELQNDPELVGRCAYFEEEVGPIINASERLQIQLDIPDIEEIKGTKDVLEQRNQLLLGNSCPTIY